MLLYICNEDSASWLKPQSTGYRLQLHLYILDQEDPVLQQGALNNKDFLASTSFKLGVI